MFGEEPIGKSALPVYIQGRAEAEALYLRDYD